ncbi:MAG: endonuclease/exonuclease/phosphatase family protein [Thermoanaerobaculia bacterium]|nr:endonuclease/exonuclease/phosphatase family protein [Thermoanaerobaculia bacterium]
MSSQVARQLSRRLSPALLMVWCAFVGCDQPSTVSIAEIQGSGHTSPLVGREVTVRGVVVAEGSLPFGDPRGPDPPTAVCWIEEEDDGDPATSRGLLVTGASAPVGREVKVTGVVEEIVGHPDHLTVTSLTADRLVEEGAGTTPEPVVLGEIGRVPPAKTIDDDGLARFEPADDAIDFWESLEGTRVRVPEPLVVGATKGRSLYVVADGARDAGPRTSAGGLRIGKDDSNPERIQVADLLLGKRIPLASVGETFSAAVEGVMHYRRGHFELLPSSLPALPRKASSPPTSVLGPRPDRLRVASLNLLNLSATDDERRFSSAAEMIVRDLGAPELLALQEVQDDSGPVDDGTVSATGTLSRLVEAVALAGGPEYRWLQQDPENNRDGGQPGGNIRSVLLFDPSRVANGRPPTGFDSNPAILDTPAFRADGGEGWRNSRKPLVARVEVLPKGEPLFVIALHLRSKGGDDSEWGAIQPPRRSTEGQRTEQAREVAGLVALIREVQSDAHLVVLGDLNEYAFRPPLLELKKAGLINLTERVPDEDRYTYVYRGNAMALDHILVSPALAEGAQVTIVHRNADIPASRQASDHDPVMASLSLP